MFDRDFVKPGKFDKTFSRWLHEAFDLRQDADYRELVTISDELTKETLEHAGIFVAGIKEHLKASIG
ncbi:MAG: hypothetical protein GY801_27040 [bacterium]|nr:hypothetical protein [bacterium]